MKKIILKQLELTNFKGKRSEIINFNDEITEILGDNGTGKTTIFDSFTWLFFGKDHNDNAKFEIKTLDSKNVSSEKLNHEVEGKFLINGERSDFKRVYKEKWTKQKGNPIAVFTGHETFYFHNDVPVTANEFAKKVSEVIDEGLFKLITNPFYFNSLPWVKRRAILEEIAGIESDEQLASGNIKFANLLIEMSGKSFDDFKKVIAATKKVLNAELEEIPIRIDEISKSIPEQINFELKKEELSKKENDLENIDSQLIDGSKVSEKRSLEVSEKQNELNVEINFQNNFKTKANAEIFEKKSSSESAKNQINNKIQQLEFSINSNENSIVNKSETVRSLKEEVIRLRSDFEKEISASPVFDELELKCPTCEHEFEPWKIDEIKKNHSENFNLEKSKKTENINNVGKQKVANIENLNKEIQLLKTTVENLKVELENENTKLKNFTDAVIDDLSVYLSKSEYKLSVFKAEEIKLEISKLREEPISLDVDFMDSLREKKRVLNSEIQSINSELKNESLIEKSKNRIVLLEEKSKEIGAKLTELEGKAFLIEQFVSFKMDKIEEAINGLFPSVKFKMFNQQINGAISETCETLINGVPFDGANNAGKIQAGIEIINVLCKFNGITAPIFVDNAESVVLLPKTESQLIKLTVSENHKSLTILN